MATGDDICKRFLAGEIDDTQLVSDAHKVISDPELASQYIQECRIAKQSIPQTAINQPIPYVDPTKFTQQEYLADLCIKLRSGQISEETAKAKMEAAGIAADYMNAWFYSCRNASIPAAPILPIDKPIAYDLVIPTMPPGFPPIDSEPLPSLPHVETQPLPTVIPLAPSCPELDQTHSVIAAVSELVGIIGTSLTEHVSESISAAIAPIVNVQNVMIGKLNTQLDTCQTSLNNCYGKVIKPIREGLGNCYGYLSNCNCPYPSEEQVCHGLQTNQYMQSVSLYPPGQEEVNQSQSQSSSPEIVEHPTYSPVSNVTNNIVNETANEPSKTIEYYPLTGGLNVGENPQYGVFNPKTGYTSVSPEEIAKATAPLEPIKTTPIVPKVEEPQYVNPTDIPQELLFIVPKWDEPTVCAMLDKKYDGHSIGQLFGFWCKDEVCFAPKWWHDIWYTEPSDKWSWIKSHGYKILYGVLLGTTGAADFALDWFRKAFRCESIPADAILVKMVMGFVNHWTDGALKGLELGFDYKLAEQCPQALPSQSECDKMYLSGLIDKSLWECWTKANNNLVNPAEKSMFSGREHIGFADALKLYRLGRMNENTYLDWCKANGVITENDRLALEKSAIDVPSVSDLIRMMVRDTGDPAVVDLYNLDDSFDLKWAGQLKKFGDSQGIDSEIAKLHWRAHWEYPSSHQAFEMLHRLRPDSPFAQRINKESIERAEKDGKKSPGIFTSFDDVQKLLEINDLSWYWRERFAAIAYRPLTRTDAQRAYSIGAIDEPTLYGVYQDEGYAPENARILTDFTKRLDAERKARKSLPRGVGASAKLHVNGLWTIEQLQAELIRLKVSETQQKEVIEQANHDRQVKIYTNAVVCIQRSYAIGTIDDSQAKAALVVAGMDAGLANDNVENLWCKKKSKDRMVSAAKLCEWRNLKLIDAEQHLRRLVNLGFSVDDANNVVKECEIDESERGWKKILKELKVEQKKIEQATSEMARQEKRARNLAAKVSKNGDDATV